MTRVPSISVVVATCAAPERVSRCARSLLATGYDDLEIVVVENRPLRSRTREVVAANFPDSCSVRVVDAARQGLSRARNVGLAAATGEIVAFVDDDVVVDPHWAGALASAFDNPQVDCVTGLIAPLALQTAEQRQFEQLAGFGKGPQRRAYRMHDRRRHGRLFPYAAGAFGSGSNTALRASVARRLGGFDEQLGTGTPARGGEDLDLYIRLLQAGHRLDYEPAAIVFHEHPTGARALHSRAFGYGVGLTAMLTRRLIAGGSRRDLIARVPAGLRHVLDPGSRKNALRTEQYPRRLVLLERLGMALGPLAVLLSAAAEHDPARSDVRGGQRQTGGNRAGASAAFRPGATGLIDLDHALGDLDAGQARSGEPYGSMLALARLHGDPLAAVELPLSAGRMDNAELAHRLWAGAGTEIESHARTCGCVSPDRLGEAQLAAGLGTVRCRMDARSRSRLPFVSVVVPTAGRPERIRTCVDSLLALDYPDFEIVIVDNAPDDPRTRAAVEGCAAGGPPVRYVSEPLPGSSVARNRGVRESRADLLAFTDDDVTVDPAWLRWMISPLLDDPATGVVTGLVMPARLDTREQRQFEELSGFGKGFDRRVYDTAENFADERLLYPYWGAVFGSGNSMAFRRRVYEQIGGLDPALGAGSPAKAGADIESFSHAIIRGSRLVYEPRAICWHDHRATEAGLRRQTFNYGVGCTAILTKWCLRDRRLRAAIAREAWRRLRPHARGREAGQTSHELERLKSQLAIHRESGMLVRQFLGFALGPALYARSLLWTRRLGLRSVLSRSGGSDG